MLKIKHLERALGTQQLLENIAWKQANQATPRALPEKVGKGKNNVPSIRLVKRKVEKGVS